MVLTSFDLCWLYYSRRLLLNFLRNVCVLLISKNQNKKAGAYRKYALSLKYLPFLAVSVFLRCLLLLRLLPSLKQLLTHGTAFRSIDDFIANANRFIDIRELTPEIVHAFVSKINVYEKKGKWSRTEATISTSSLPQALENSIP